MTAKSQFITINGLRLHYLDFGNAGKPPLICIHGLSGNAHNFEALAAHLVPDYHVISIDVRGRGDSQWGPADEYNQTSYSSDLAMLIDRLRFPRVTLIGTSMGGAIAMLYAGGYPDRVERMVLNDVGPEVDPSGIKRITAYMTSAPTEFGSLAEVGDYYRQNYPAMRQMLEHELLEFVKWTVKPAENGTLRWKIDPAVRNTPRSGSSARPLDMWVPYARITAPILVVRGADSDILARATVERMGAVLPGLTTVVEVPGVGHAPSLLEPEALNAIKQFLAR
jgi:pimeloyl-ACP methyl ester carboxylesterase